MPESVPGLVKDVAQWHLDKFKRWKYPLASVMRQRPEKVVKLRSVIGGRRNLRRRLHSALLWILRLIRPALVCGSVLRGYPTRKSKPPASTTSR